MQIERLSGFLSDQSESLAGRLWILDETRSRDWTP
jgi:hypothetical protein